MAIAFALGRNASGGGRVYWPRIRTVYLVRRLVCSLTPIRRRGKEGAHSEGRRKALCSAVVFVVSLHAASDATTLCRRRQQHNGGGEEGERYQKERISKGRSLMNE